MSGIAPRQTLVKVQPLSGASSVSQGIITYPGSAGDLAPLGVGKTLLDLVTGKVSKYDNTSDAVSTSLGALGAQYASAMFLWSDVDLNFRFRLGSSWNQLISYQQASSPQYYIPFDAIELTLVEAGNVFFQAFTSSLPTAIFPPNSFQLRYASGTTTSTQTAIPWQASNIGGGLSNVGASYTTSPVTTRAMKTKSFIIFNTDAANSLNANLQGQAFPGSNWADDASTGTSIAITAGNSALLNISALYLRMRLRLQDTTSGSHASFQLQYVGVTT